MTNGDILAINGLLGDIKLPPLNGDDFYKVLSCKADIAAEAEKIFSKIEKFKKEDSNRIDELINNLCADECKESVSFNVIPKSVLPDLCAGLTLNAAMLLKKYLLEE